MSALAHAMALRSLGCDLSRKDGAWLVILPSHILHAMAEPPIAEPHTAQQLGELLDALTDGPGPSPVAA